MTISDEQLMALVDGECTAQERLSLEASAAADPELSRRYAAQRALRDRLRLYFNAIMKEPVPRRLLDATLAAQPRRHKWGLDAPRLLRRRSALRMSLLAEWARSPTQFAIAASLAGVMILGVFMLKLSMTTQITLIRGELAADGALAQALSRQLAAEPPSGPVRIGVTFVSKSGEYCRTFIEGRVGDTVAGLACRDRDTWRLKVLESSTETLTDRGSYAQAATTLSPAILHATEALIHGDPLDAPGEAAARAGGWKVGAAGRNGGN